MHLAAVRHAAPSATRHAHAGSHPRRDVPAATPGSPTGAAPSTATPGVAFGMPTWLASALDNAARAGQLAAAAAPAGDAAFAAWAVANFPPAPPAASDQQELVWMHRLKDSRNASQNQTAVWFADDGDVAIWDGLLAQWQQTVGPRQAAWGAALLNEARLMNKPINDDAKLRFGRARPYTTDPSLEPVVDLSTAGSKSYPSGHVAHSFLQATIMAALMPDRAPEFMALARQMAMARMYGGVHYPTDTIGGAWEGALVATWLLRHRPRPQG